MRDRTRSIQRAVGIGLAWAVLWLALGLAIGTVIGVFDPDSIDPGDIEGVAMVFGSMGFFTGVVFTIVASLVAPGMSPVAFSLPRVALWATVATAIVQVGYLNHGDAGLIANLQIALLFSTFGAPIAIAWLLIARRGRRRAHHTSRASDHARH